VGDRGAVARPDHTAKRYEADAEQLGDFFERTDAITATATTPSSAFLAAKSC
jgi:hypothetical protein